MYCPYCQRLTQYILWPYMMMDSPMYMPVSPNPFSHDVLQRSGASGKSAHWSFQEPSEYAKQFDAWAK